jgi:hypothetical protein
MVTMMKRKILSRTTIFLAMSKLSFILAVNPFGLSVQGADAPNIIFLFTDDQAAWAVGANDSQAKTPHMDRLFKEGAHLENAFTVTPVCSPSRASLMTSRYGTEFGSIRDANRI